MGESEIEVRLDLLDVLLRVARHYPAPVSDVANAFGQLFHLARIMDACFLLSRERERGPNLRVLACTAQIRIEGDFDLDHLFELRVVAAGCLSALPDRRQQRVLVKLHPLA